LFGLHKPQSLKIKNLLLNKDDIGSKIMFFSSIPDWPASFYAGIINISLTELFEAIFSASIYYLLFVIVGCSSAYITVATRAIASACFLIGNLIAMLFV